MKLVSLILSTAIGAYALLAVAVSAETDSIPIPSLRILDKGHFLLPAVPDSVSPENPFKPESLFESSKPVSPAREAINNAALRKFVQSQRADWTTLLPDTAGNFRLGSGPVDGVDMKRAKASLRPDGFFKGSVVVSAKSPARIYVDGEKIAEKSSIDTVPADLKGNITLAPGQDAEIVVDFLLTAGMENEEDFKLYLKPDKGSETVSVALNPDKRHFNISTTTEGPRVATVNVSPDGKYVIVKTTETSSGKSPVISVDIRDCGTGKPVRMNMPENIDWLPSEGSVLYRNIDKADGTFDIVIEKISTGENSLLASGLPSEARSYRLAPTSDFILYYSKVDGKKEEGIMRKVLSPDDRIPGNRNRSYIKMIRFEDLISRPVTAGGVSTWIEDISRDGKHLLCSSHRFVSGESKLYEYTLVDIDLETLKQDTLFTKEPTLDIVRFSPDGKEIFITGGPNNFNGIGLNCGTHPIGNDYDVQGYIMTLADRKVRPVTRDFDPSLSPDVFWNKTDNNIYFRAITGFDSKLYRLNPESGDIKELPTEIDYIRQFSIGCDESRYIGYCGMSYDYMGRAMTLDLKNGKSSILADPASPVMEGIELGDSEMWSFTAPDGTIVEGTLTFPPNFDPSAKYPLIVYYYGGTTPSTHTNHSPYSAHLFASYGYVVYILNPSGTIGYGQEYSARHVNAWGERTADEIIYGTEELCRTHPFIDAAHVGCLGASYGGFMTQLLTTRTDLFAAAVSHAGISNVASYWGEGYWGYSYNAVAAAGSFPWSRPEIFTRNSSLFNADKIHTPLLLLHGSVDTNVPIGESIQLFNALRILGREVEFITVDGENHIIMDFEKKRKWHATIMAWFEKWLKKDSRWWDSIYSK